ncbi:MAG: RNA methyltransferase [Planctomycetes bacterium]|nr:RNA methyltransferase [Planctomycetota bacterium]
MTVPVKRITSTQNPYVKKVVSIRDDGLVRQQEGLFFLEGERAVAEAVAHGHCPVDLIYVPRMLEEEPAVVEEASSGGARLVSVSKDVYKKMAGTKNPVWVAGLFALPRRNLLDVVVGTGIYVVASNIQDPGNLGTIWRSAGCFGARALLVSTPACDLHNGKVLRASAGAVFAVPAVKARPKDIMSSLDAAGIPVYGADVHGGMEICSLGGLEKAAIAVGHETQGLHADIERGLAGTFKIPMAGIMDSLNVATAAGVALYELTRGRISGRP